MDESNIRMPAVLVPSFQKLINTPEGKDAMKRIRVECGVCRVTRFYSIHRGITRISGIVACEACRQFYQRFNKQPFPIYCSKGGRCFAQEEFHKTATKCKACWVAEILSRCPVAEGVYNRFVVFLPEEIKERMRGHPLLQSDVAKSERGALGLEILKNNDWVDVTEKWDGTRKANEDDGFEPDLGMEFEAEEETVDNPISQENSGVSPSDGASTSTSITNTSGRGRGRRAKRLEGRESMDPDDRDVPADGTTVVMATLLEGLHDNNQFKFMENFNPKNSERVRRKKKKVQYFSSTGRGKRDAQALHAGDGTLAGSGKNLCDCLQTLCPGCHFPCVKCGSGKCGTECRVNRKWCYESVEVEGTKLKWYNEFMKK